MKIHYGENGEEIKSDNQFSLLFVKSICGIVDCFCSDRTKDVTCKRCLNIIQGSSSGRIVGLEPIDESSNLSP